MTRDDIIRMAREAHISHIYSDDSLVRFAALVAAAARDRTWTHNQWTEYERAIVAAEREKCAKLREAARQALAWLQAEQSAADEDCGDPACDECEGIVRPRQRIIDALREALK